MTMEEISCAKYQKSAHQRLSLESINKDSEIEFRFVWRGNKRGINGFINSPAHFRWKLLGKLIRDGFDSGKIKDKDINDFLNCFDLKEKK
jgi:hypothetical protein